MFRRLTLLAATVASAWAQSFPPVKNWDSVKITLKRSSCFGGCPQYEVEIRDGVVHYWANFFTLVRGHHLGEMTRPELQQLIDEFRRADYMKLSERYGNPVLDAATFTISASIDGASNTLVHYTRSSQTVPAVVIALEDSIDRLAHTAKWVEGNKETIPALRREGFDFGSPPAAEIIRWAVRGDPEGCASISSQR